MSLQHSSRSRMLSKPSSGNSRHFPFHYFTRLTVAKHAPLASMAPSSTTQPLLPLTSRASSESPTTHASGRRRRRVVSRRLLTVEIAHSLPKRKQQQ